MLLSLAEEDNGIGGSDGDGDGLCTVRTRIWEPEKHSTFALFYSVTFPPILAPIITHNRVAQNFY